MIYFFIGTIAEFIKVFPVLRKLEDENIEYKILSSNQNDLSKSELRNYLKKFSPINVSISPKKQNIKSLVVWFIKSIFISLTRMKSFVKKGDVVVVHGDTLSSVLGAFVSRILGLKVVHLEAGLRSFNLLRPFPEEICRRLSSFLSDAALCPNEWAMNNLKSNKIVKINTRQNTLYESCKFALSVNPDPEIMKKVPKKPYFIFITHRQENIYNRTLLTKLIKTAIDLSREMNCVFVLHSSTKEVLKKLHLLEKLETSKGIYIFERIPYITFTHILNGAEYIITDGGSNQEESFYLGKPCLILRRETERIEGIGRNVVISRLDLSIIYDFVKNYKSYATDSIQEDILPSSIVIDFLNKFA